MAVDRHSVKGRAWMAMKKGFGALHIASYRLSGGKLGGRMARTPVLLLTVTGRKSGKARTVPLVYFEDDGAFVVASSNAGHWEPQWFRNVLANSAVRVQVGKRKFEAIARVAGTEESAALWTRMEAHNPAFAEYPKSRGVAIPMVVLTPTGAS